ncbi:MAG: hypothetical protein SF172_17965 [Burkholderiales bacterium]|nr:hypothetical protein [Burkholderiales bacterium]
MDKQTTPEPTLEQLQAAAARVLQFLFSSLIKDAEQMQRLKGSDALVFVARRQMELRDMLVKTGCPDDDAASLSQAYGDSLRGKFADAPMPTSTVQ